MALTVQERLVPMAVSSEYPVRRWVDDIPELAEDCTLLFWCIDVPNHEGCIMLWADSPQSAQERCAYIVQAVNSHEALVEALDSTNERLKATVKQLERAFRWLVAIYDHSPEAHQAVLDTAANDCNMLFIEQILEEARAALSAAEAKESR